MQTPLRQTVRQQQRQTPRSSKPLMPLPPQPGRMALQPVHLQARMQQICLPWKPTAAATQRQKHRQKQQQQTWTPRQPQRAMGRQQVPMQQAQQAPVMPRAGQQSTAGQRVLATLRQRRRQAQPAQQQQPSRRHTRRPSRRLLPTRQQLRTTLSTALLATAATQARTTGRVLTRMLLPPTTVATGRTLGMVGGMEAATAQPMAIQAMAHTLLAIMGLSMITTATQQATVPAMGLPRLPALLQLPLPQQHPARTMPAMRHRALPSRWWCRRCP